MRGVDVALDGDGRFTAGGLAAGPVQLMVIAPDAFRATSRPIVVPYAGEFLFVVDAGLLSLRGRVVADVDGSPVPGAVVTAAGRGGELTVVASRARSDAEGRFEVLVSPSEGWSVQVTADGFAPSFRQGAEVSSNEPIEVRLVKGATLRGRVTREGDGGAAAGLTVLVVPIGDARGYAAGGGSGTTDADGRYEITGLSSGEAGAIAEGPGWITKGIRQFDDRGYNPLAIALTPGATTVFDLVVVPGARAEGVVLDTAGSPVAGAVVTAQPSGGMRSFQMFGLGTSTTASGADGTFVLDALMPNLAYGFIAQAPGYAPTSAGPLVTTEAGVVTVEIRFPAPRFLDVTVLDDASGAPIAGARVSGGAPSASVTGADGVARVGPVPPHGVSLWVDSDGYIASARGGDISVPDGDTSRVVRLSKALEIAGRVVAADHSPAPGATVELQSLGQDRGGRGPSTVTAADGTFRFRGLPSLGYTVRARLRADGTSLAGSATASAGATDVVITLGTGTGEDLQTTLLVRAVDPSGKPVLRATVRWVSPSAGSRGTSMTDGVARIQIGANRDRRHRRGVECTGRRREPAPARAGHGARGCGRLRGRGAPASGGPHRGRGARAGRRAGPGRGGLGRPEGPCAGVRVVEVQRRRGRAPTSRVRSTWAGSGRRSTSSRCSLRPSSSRRSPSPRRATRSPWRSVSRPGSSRRSPSSTRTGSPWSGRRFVPTPTSATCRRS